MCDVLEESQVWGVDGAMQQTSRLGVWRRRLYSVPPVVGRLLKGDVIVQRKPRRAGEGYCHEAGLESGTIHERGVCTRVTGKMSSFGNCGVGTKERNAYAHASGVEVGGSGGGGAWKATYHPWKVGAWKQTAEVLVHHPC
jgi:hypothetical protein